MEPYYSDDLVTIYHGDSRQIVPTLPKFDLVLADPPYAFGGGRSEWQITAAVAIAVSESAKRVKPKGAMALMTASSGRGIEYAQGCVGGTLRFNRLLVWHKTFVNSAVAGPWRWDLVPILMFGRATFGRPAHSSCYRSAGHASAGTHHPAALPPSLGRWLIEPFGDQVETVLDPFMGSGSFTVAARDLGKKVVAVERDEAHCELAVRRLGQHPLALEEVVG